MASLKQPNCSLHMGPRAFDFPGTLLLHFSQVHRLDWVASPRQVYLQNILDYITVLLYASSSMSHVSISQQPSHDLKVGSPLPACPLAVEKL